MYILYIIFLLILIVFICFFYEHPLSTSRFMSHDADEINLPQSGLDNQSIAVIGGGVSGLSASKYLLEAGAKVTLLEKRNIVGGNNDPYLENGKHYATTVIVTYPCQQPHYLNLCRELGIPQIQHDFAQLKGAIILEDRKLITKMGSGAWTFMKYIWHQCSMIELIDGACIMLLFYHQFKLRKESKKSIKDVLGNRLVKSRVFTHIFMPWIGINTWCRFDDIASQPAHIFGAFIFEYALPLKIRKKDYLFGENGWCVLDGRIIHRLEKKLLNHTDYEQHLNCEVKDIFRKNKKLVVVSDDKERVFDKVLIATQPFQALPIIQKIATYNLTQELKKWPKMDCYVILHSDFENIKNMPWVHQTYTNQKTQKYYITNTIKPIMSDIKFDRVITFVYNTENYDDFLANHIDKEKIIKIYTPKLPIFTLDNSVNRNQIWNMIDKECEDVYWTQSCRSGIQYHNNGILNSKRVVKTMIEKSRTM